METIQGFDFFKLHFNNDGGPANAQELTDWKAQAAKATDAIFIAHGFRNDENDATGLYTKFLTSLRGHVNGSFKTELGGRRFVVAGVFWPSKAFKEGNVFGDGSAQSVDDETRQKQSIHTRLLELQKENPAHAAQLAKAIELLEKIKGNAAAQDEFVSNLFSLLDTPMVDPNEGITKIRAAKGSELLNRLKEPIILPLHKEAHSEGGALAVATGGGHGQQGGVLSIGSFFGSIFGRVDQVLNVTTWYTMKNRCGVVGAKGVADAVRALKQDAPAVRVHLVGHSLGGRLMASCAKSLTTAPQVKPRSLTLLEAAFSHYGFSPNNGTGVKGFFREVISSQAIDGPMLATFSAKDTVVGKVYAIASRLAGDSVKAVGDANDLYGGIGRNGAQKTVEASAEALRDARQTGGAALPGRYQFPSGKVVNLDGSNGLINGHGDITNESVTFAFASALAQA